MRMWMVPAELLCQQHLNGEHGEIHKFRPSFVKKYSIVGRMSPIVQIEPFNMAVRHDQLAAEMLRRGGNHKSPYTLPDLSYLPKDQLYATADLLHNLIDLSQRCEECKNRINVVVSRDYHAIMHTFNISFSEAQALYRKVNFIISKGAINEKRD